MSYNWENAFWERVDACKHENLSPDYAESGPCDCYGWNESHCLDCGVYIRECQCGAQCGKSGWPHKRWRAIELAMWSKHRQRIAKSKEE